MYYKLDDFMALKKLFRFEFDNGMWIALDLANDYPNYICPMNSGISDYTHMTCIKDGNIKVFKTSDLRKKTSIIKLFEHDGIIYKKTNQLEFDKFKYKIDPNSDNGRVFHLLDTLYTNNKKIKTSLII